MPEAICMTDPSLVPGQTGHGDSCTPANPEPAGGGGRGPRRVKRLRLCGRLFLSTFYISAFTFGGGFVIIPLMKKKFCDELHWLEEQEMLDMAAIAQSSPGAVAVNASVLTGFRIAGIPGALTAILGTVLPPLLVLSVVSLFYDAFRSNPVVAAVLKGMQAGIAAVIADVVFSLGGDVLRSRQPLSIFLMAGAFAAALLLPINVIWILLFCGAAGIARGLYALRRGKRRPAPPSGQGPEGGRGE